MKNLLNKNLLNFNSGKVTVEMAVLLGLVEGRITPNVQDYKRSHKKRLDLYTYKHTQVSDVTLIKYIKIICTQTIHYMIQNLTQICIWDSLYKVEIRNEFFLFCGDVGCWYDRGKLMDKNMINKHFDKVFDENYIKLLSYTEVPHDVSGKTNNKKRSTTKYYLKLS